MKKYFLILLAAAMFSGTLFAQTPAISTRYSDAEIDQLIHRYENSRTRDERVTGDLLQKFRNDFPEARFVEWETNGELYEVEFNLRWFRDATAFYDKDGNLLMYKMEISERNLPAIVKTAAEARYPKFRFDEIEKVVKGTRTFYKIEMELRLRFEDTDVSMVISDEGKFIDR